MKFRVPIMKPSYESILRFLLGLGVIAVGIAWANRNELANAILLWLTGVTIILTSHVTDSERKVISQIKKLEDMIEKLKKDVEIDKNTKK